MSSPAEEGEGTTPAGEGADQMQQQQPEEGDHGQQQQQQEEEEEEEENEEEEHEEEEVEAPPGPPPDPSQAFCRSVELRIEESHQHASSSSHSNDDDVPDSSEADAADAEHEEAMERTVMAQAQLEETRLLREASMAEILRVGSRKTVSNESQLDMPMPSGSGSGLRQQSIAEGDEGKEREKIGGESPGRAGKKKGASKIGVFNANSAEGCSIVRTLAKQGCEVVAVVRVTTSRNVRRMVRLPNVRVVVADSLHDREALADAVRGCGQVFYVLKYWERFDGALEETQTFTVFDSCYLSDVSWVVFTTYEEVTELKRKGRKSQIVPRSDGTVAMPSFDGLKRARLHADERGIRVTHMITSYIDSKKRSLTLIKGGEKLIVVSNK